MCSLKYGLKASISLLFLVLLIPFTALGMSKKGESQKTVEPKEIFRVATFNVSFNRPEEGGLLFDLKSGKSQQIKNIAEIIQRVDPDIIFLNEFDYDAEKRSLDLFREKYLEISQNKASTVKYPYSFTAEVNTGIASGKDLDNNGKIGGPNDAFGYGKFPGQYGMVVLSKWPILKDQVRTFQKFLWKDMPNALLPSNPRTSRKADWYSKSELNVFRLSSKSHWDVPIQIGEKVVHILASHPTPPAFDGAEERNKRRNHDEIKFWQDYISQGQKSYHYDDQGKKGGLSPDNAFIIVGDLNADPCDGSCVNNPIESLLSTGKLNAYFTPSSEGAVETNERQKGINLTHQGEPKYDTANFPDPPGNLRADYVLPSQHLQIIAGGVFWPSSQHIYNRLIRNYKTSSDHHLVWLDLAFQ